MTAGHRHRTVRVKRDGLVMRVLRARIYHTHDFVRVDDSPYPYGKARCGGYYLSTLSVLHRWTGLTLEVRD